jgi:hypothetical protein
LALLDATLATLGTDEATRHWRRSTLRAFDLPLIKPFVDGAMGLFRVSPAQILPLLPKLDRLMHRNTRTVVEIVSDREARIRHPDLPDEVLASPAWPLSVSTSYAVTLEFLRAIEPHVESSVDAARREAVFTLRWRLP